MKNSISIRMSDEEMFKIDQIMELIEISDGYKPTRSNVIRRLLSIGEQVVLEMSEA